MAKAHRNQAALGNILMELGHADKQTIGRALRCDSPLEQTLLEWDAITPEQLQEAQLYQKVYRGEISATEASRCHKERRRALMSDVLERLRTMAQLTHNLNEQLK